VASAVLPHPAGAGSALVDLSVQRASAAWLAEHGARRPVVVTFYAVGTYELLSDGAVQPVYVYPLLREAKDRSEVPDFVAIWRSLLPADQSRFAVLPLGENPIEAQHFDEPAIRAALLRSRGERSPRSAMRTATRYLRSGK
jgi:hypothetical protein